MTRFLAASMAILCAGPAYARGGDGGGALIFLAVIVGGAFLWGWVNSIVARQVEGRVQARMSQVNERERQAMEGVFKRQQQAQQEIAADRTRLQSLQAQFDQSYVNGRRWLAEFIAEAFQAAHLASAGELIERPRPAYKAADEVRRIAAELRELRANAKITEYTLKTLYEYYPVLEDYADDILNEKASVNLAADEGDAEADRVATYISKEEYDRLKPVERNQLALDKWRARPKSNVEIGRMFERYVGHRHELDGWAVEFFGAIQGFDDLGRDLICTKGDVIKVIQAKCWSQHRVIHEKHIFQLYGTCVLLRRDKRAVGKKIIPSFWATTALSDTALWAARELGIEIVRSQLDSGYPMIKCNVNAGTKIYHLPFDQQYDRVKIIAAKGECYVATAKAAEAKGFRRAKRHFSMAA